MLGRTTRRSERAGAKRLLIASVAALWILAMPASAMAANAYGQTFAGQEKCLSCHGNESGRWQVGTYRSSAHGQFVTDVQKDPSALVPAAGSTTQWPSPSLGNGLRFGSSEIWLTLGSPGMPTAFVTTFKNNGPQTLESGQELSPVSAGPADDSLIMRGSEWIPAHNTWELSSPAKVNPYFQSCGGCHFLGVTRPTWTDYTLSSGATVSRSTETSYSGFGIQCEHCHGTGREGTTHWTAGVDIVRTKDALDSQVCGQCHVNGTAKEKNYDNKTFSSPNGYTPDRDLDDFLNVAGIEYVRTSSDSPQPTIPVDDAKFYPNGTNKKMHHSYYNEWLISGHARSLRFANGELWTSHASDSCLPCHSGEGFLESMGYGTPGPNDIGLGGSSLETDELDIECGVCHTVHAQGDEPLGLRLEAEELCSKCHNAQSESGQELAAGKSVHHPQAEMRNGYGLIGVPSGGKRFMDETTCPDCHMPVTYENRVSHRFKVMTPGDAAEWNVQENGDSCTPCHASKTREQLQADLDKWSEQIEAGIADAREAIAAAQTRAAASTAAGNQLIGSATTNVSYVDADGSHGAHNFPYAMAGLEKAEYFARSVGSAYTRFGTTAYDKTMRLSMVFGTLRFGDGAAAAGETVAIQAKPAGSSTWTTVGKTTVGADGDFSYAVSPSGITSYRAAWSPLKDQPLYSKTSTVSMGTTTSIKISSKRFARGRTATVSGAVSPAHAGKKVTIKYKRGSGSWKTLTTRTLGSKSTYSFSWKPSTRGTYYLQASFAGDVSHKGSKSSTLTVKVY